MEGSSKALLNSRGAKSQGLGHKAAPRMLPTCQCSLLGSHWKAGTRPCPVSPMVSSAATPQTAVLVEARCLKTLLKAMSTCQKTHT